MEAWRDIKGYEGFYQVSNLGNVKSLRRILHSKNQFKKYTTVVRERILKPATNNHGYRTVVLQNRGKKTISVHRLVAIAFISNPKNKPQVNHKNGIKSDNRLENLEWANNSENQIHSYAINLAKPTFGNAKLSKLEVLEIRKKYSSGNITQAELSRRFGVYKTTINKIVRNQIWTNI